MMNTIQKKGIIAVSVVIPLAVALLFKIHIPGVDLHFLPPIYATTNALTAIFLLLALWAIKQKNINLHAVFIKIALGFSVLFLLMYVAYHATSEPTPYAGDYKTLYYSILISHIVLSVIVIPLVLWSYVYGSAGDATAHKKIVKYAFPIWLYVAVTGVVVYVLISPYYSV
jgi:putative membrane protein